MYTQENRGEVKIIAINDNKTDKKEFYKCNLMINGTSPKGYQWNGTDGFGYKKATDIIISIKTLMLTLPLFVAIALSLKVQRYGPVMFCQQRTGLDGKPFNIYKLR